MKRGVKNQRKEGSFPPVRGQGLAERKEKKHDCRKLRLGSARGAQIVHGGVPTAGGMSGAVGGEAPAQGHSSRVYPPGS